MGRATRRGKKAPAKASRSTKKHKPSEETFILVAAEADMLMTFDFLDLQGGKTRLHMPNGLATPTKRAPTRACEAVHKI
eukprot:8308982-Lingulodinium_polyedra.AAC.1